MSGGVGTNFFERQDDARKKTMWLFVLLALAVAVLSVGTFLIVGAALLVVLPLVVESLTFQDVRNLIPWAQVMVGSAVVTAGFVIIASVYKRWKLGDGGAALIEGFGGTEVYGGADNDRHRRLINVVEEMSIAAGIPVPRIYVLEQQPGINAFAAGYTANDAGVAVTEGALQELNRDQLQALVAHEFSHILNGDMRLNVRLIGIVHGMMLPYLTGRTIWNFEAGESTVGGMYLQALPDSTLRRVGCGSSMLMMGCVMVPFVMFPAAILAFVGRIGAAFAEGIKSAIGRQREYLADAAAVQFTRNPEAMIAVLEKIRSHPSGSRLRGARARVISHMCFGNVAGRYRRGGGALSSHPPLTRRIEKLGAMPEPGRHHRIVVREDIEVDTPHHDEDEIAAMARRHDDAGGAVDPGEIVEQVAEPNPEKLVYCASLIDDIPQQLRQVRGEVLEAAAIATLLVLDPDSQVRARQAKVVQEHGSNALRSECQRLWPLVSNLDRRLELPLIDLLFPALRRMSEEQFAGFSQMLDEMVHVDGAVAFRDFIIEWILLHRLEMALLDANRDIVQHRSFRGMARDIQLVLSCIAEVGDDDPEGVVTAFETGREALPTMIRDDLEFQSPSSWTFDDVGQALDRLAVSSSNIKRVVVLACAHSVISDGQLAVAEMEMFRAIAEALEVPIGPSVARRTPSL